MKTFDHFSLSFRLHGLIQDHGFVSDLFEMDPFVMRGAGNKLVPVGSDSPATYISYTIEVEEDTIPPETLIQDWIDEHSNILIQINRLLPDVRMGLILNIYGHTWVEWSFALTLLESFCRHHINFGVEIWREDPDNEFREYYYPEAPPREHPLSDNTPDYQFDRVEVTGLSEEELTHNLMRLSKNELYGYIISPCRTMLSIYHKQIFTVFDSENRRSFLEFIRQLKDLLILPEGTLMTLKSEWILYRNSRGEEMDYEFFGELKDLEVELKLRVEWVKACPVEAKDDSRS